MKELHGYRFDNWFDVLCAFAGGMMLGTSAGGFFGGAGAILLLIAFTLPPKGKPEENTSALNKS
jgi:hypothetical protein